MTYKVVTLPATFSGEINKAVASYQATIDQYATEGWKLVTVTTISSHNKEGCMKSQDVLYTATLLIFGKEN